VKLTVYFHIVKYYNIVNDKEHSLVSGVLSVYGVFAAFSVGCITGCHMVAGKLGPTLVQQYSCLVHAYPSHVLSVLGLSAWRSV